MVKSSLLLKFYIWVLFTIINSFGFTQVKWRAVRKSGLLVEHPVVTPSIHICLLPYVDCLSHHSTPNYFLFSFLLSFWLYCRHRSLKTNLSYIFSNGYCFPSRWWRNVWLSAIVRLTDVFLIVLGRKIHRDLREKSLSLPTRVGEVLVRKM